jgi:hypothetical protein
MTAGEHEEEVRDDPQIWAVITRSDDDYNRATFKQWCLV